MMMMNSVAVACTMRRSVTRPAALLITVVSLLPLIAAASSSSHLLPLLDSVELFFDAVSHFVTRRSLFLLCNAILLFVFHDSGLLSLTGIPAAGQSQDSITAMTIERPRRDETTEAMAVEEIGLPLELIVDAEEEVVEEEEKEMVEVDELNRRCEEFIERVKRERQSEARRQIVMV